MSESRFRFRRAKTDGPIIINGVTYRSREEIPENLRPLWDDFERKLEKAEFPFSAIPSPPPYEPEPPAKTLSSTAMFLTSLAGAFALAFYGMFYDDPSLIFPVYSGWVIVSFVVLLGPWVYMLVRHHRNERLIRGWKPKREALVGVAVGLLFTHMGAFHGVAKLLHHLDNQPGEMMATVSGKYGYSRKHCAHFTLQEFRFFGDRVCVNARFFEAVKVGDRIRVTGHMSRYGLAPYELETVDE